VRPVTVQSYISAPREEVFDYIADLANHVAFTDHYLREFHLARAKSSGLGAAARFRVDLPSGHQWVEVQVVEHQRPRLLAMEGHGGRLGRVRIGIAYELSDEAGVTRVGMSTWTEPATRTDRLREALGARRWLKRQNRIALERLRKVFEERPAGELARATVAGFEPEKAVRFG
jgi:uncharacterized protein YndB with AHSA1/START domain